MSRPTVSTKCPADAYHGPHERIGEFTFPDGRGGLISFRVNALGQAVVDVYRCDPGVVVMPPPVKAVPT